ncbi:MAG: serine hydrolase [Arthrobacter sp.]|nr:serine hydrolase [Arthrobacter sp.]
MDSIDPRPQLRSGRRRQGSGNRGRGLFRRRRPQILTAAAAALILLSGTAVCASIQAGPPADAVAPPESSVSGPQTVPGTADAGTNGGATAIASSSTSAPPVSPSPSASATPIPPTPTVAAPGGTAAPFSPAFDGPINAIIDANSRYAVGVALIDVNDGVVHEYGDNTKFAAASTAKILAAAAYYHLVETGRASLATRMGSSTAAVQIRQMVQQSNNDSWALILRAVGHQGLTAYAASLSISYDRTVNLLSPAETAKTLSLLYTGQLLNPVNTAQLLSYMQRTNYETLIPAAVPAGIEVYHKYGLLSGNLHDASILVQGDRAYVFVVYTRGQSGADMPARTRIIHQLTQTVAAGLF